MQMNHENMIVPTRKAIYGDNTYVAVDSPQEIPDDYLVKNMGALLIAFSDPLISSYASAP